MNDDGRVMEVVEQEEQVQPTNDDGESDIEEVDEQEEENTLDGSAVNEAQLKNEPLLLGISRKLSKPMR